jgi:hypothetical protein
MSELRPFQAANNNAVTCLCTAPTYESQYISTRKHMTTLYTDTVRTAAPYSRPLTPPTATGGSHMAPLAVWRHPVVV